MCDICHPWVLHSIVIIYLCIYICLYRFPNFLISGIQTFFLSFCLSFSFKFWFLRGKRHSYELIHDIIDLFEHQLYMSGGCHCALCHLQRGEAYSPESQRGTGNDFHGMTMDAHVFQKVHVYIYVYMIYTYIYTWYIYIDIHDVYTNMHMYGMYSYSPCTTSIMKEQKTYLRSSRHLWIWFSVFRAGIS